MAIDKARAGMLVSIIFTVSALLGFAREIVLAAYFGTSSQADALLVAMLIPNFFLALLGEASLGAAVVPVFVSFISPKTTKEQRAIVGSGFALISLILVPLTALAILFAPILSRLFAPGFDPDSLRLTASLMRIMLPSVVFLGLANFTTGILHAFRRFGGAAATGAVFNLAVVLATIPLARRFGIAAPALGVLVGSILQLGVMLPPLAKTGFLSAMGFRFRDPALTRIWIVFWPILLSSLVVQLIETVDKIVASFLPVGSIAALNYAAKLSGGPSRIFAMAVAVVLFPSFAKDVSEKSSDLARRVANGFNVSALLVLPWAAILVALSAPIVAALLQRGAFDARATALVALPLAIYAPGKFAEGITTMLNNAFYSHHDSHTPAAIHVGTKILRVILIFALLRPFGYLALALAQVVTVIVAVVLLLLFLREKIPDLDLKGMGWTTARVSTASAIGGLVAWLSYGPAETLIGRGSNVALIGSLALSTALALIAYLIAVRILRVEEVGDVTRTIQAFVVRRQTA